MKRYFCFFSEILKSIENYKMPSKRIRRRLARKKLEKELLVSVPASVFVPEPEPEPEPEPLPPQSVPMAKAEETCIYIIGRGKRKGQECGKKCKEGLYCSLHMEKSLSD
tara:strand:- start:9 stop:335 length:327 start_codon:yes stop_codon:yes gene_type:complete